MSDTEMLLRVIEANTAALSRVAAAIDNNAEKNHHLGSEMKRMVGTIAGWQGKVGGKLGPMIESQKLDIERQNEEKRAELMALKGRNDARV